MLVSLSMPNLHRPQSCPGLLSVRQEISFQAWPSDVPRKRMISSLQPVSAWRKWTEITGGYENGAGLLPAAFQCGGRLLRPRKES